MLMEKLKYALKIPTALGKSLIGILTAICVRTLCPHDKVYITTLTDQLAQEYQKKWGVPGLSNTYAAGNEEGIIIMPFRDLTKLMAHGINSDTKLIVDELDSSVLQTQLATEPAIRPGAAKDPDEMVKRKLQYRPY